VTGANTVAATINAVPTRNAIRRKVAMRQPKWPEVGVSPQETNKPTLLGGRT
jgi:hypothetical protein